MSDPLVEVAKIVVSMYNHVFYPEDDPKLSRAWAAFNEINRNHPHFLGECMDLIKDNP